MTDSLGPGWAPKKPPPEGDGGEAPKPKRFWWRFTLAAVLIIAVSAATTATATLLYLDSIANAIQPKNDKLQKKLNRFLADAGSGGAQTFLVIGSDKRASEAEDPGRSDTTMLVRLDPDKGLISMMSIPRDLKVEIPGYGTGKFNEAYSYGGTEADPADGEVADRAADQPRRQRRLPRLRPGGLRDRLRLHRRRPPLLPLQRRRGALRTVRRNQRPAGLPADVRQAGARLRPLPPHRHRHRPLGPPAGLPQPGPLADLGSGHRLRPGRTGRGLHRLHHLRHQRRRDPAGSAETAGGLAQLDDQRGPLPGRTRPQLRLHDRKRARRGRAGIPRRRDRAGGESGAEAEP